MTMRFASAGSSAYASPLAAAAAFYPAYEEGSAGDPTSESRRRAAPSPLRFRLAVGLSALGLSIAALFPLAAPYAGSAQAQIVGGVLGLSLLLVLSHVFDIWHRQKVLAAADAGAWDSEVGSGLSWARTTPQGGRRKTACQRSRGRAARSGESRIWRNRAVWRAET